MANEKQNVPEQRSSSEEGKKPPPPRYPMGPIWILVAVAILLLIWNPFGREDRRQISYSSFRAQVQAGNVESIVVRGEGIQGVFEQPVERRVNDEVVEVTEFRTHLPAFGDEQLLALLETQGVEIETRPEGNILWWIIGLNMLPFLLLVLIGIIIFTRMRSQGQGMFSMVQSRAKLYDKEKATTDFDDVAGTEGAKEELQETVSFLKDPARFKQLGGTTPKGVLLIGPPGTGKTLLARAVAGEAGVPFFSTSGSDFMEMFVGIGAARVRKMFEDAKKSAPSIIFIDELDSIGRRRGTGIGGGHDEREQTLNQILSEMDGFEQNEGVIVMAATNRPDVLDNALLRPGRFDRQVTVDLPNKTSREAILKIHARKKKFADDVDFEKVARATPSFSGADLANLLNEAALLATRENKKAIEMADISTARDKIMLGRKREGMVISQDDMKLLAYHEAGHAVVAAVRPYTDPIEKVTIVPRGHAMGVTQQLPEEEKYIFRQEYLRDRLAVMMGGRAAEEMVFETATSGAANDLMQVTRLARRMVMEFGMSDDLGFMAFGEQQHVFLGEQMGQQRDHSEATAELIDTEVKKILRSSYDLAYNTIKEHREGLDRLADRLLEKEEVSGDEVLEILHVEKKHKRPTEAKTE
ncbi:MAG: ATP-dependent zinc metalloprotease FtsH [Opitutales bacterium]